MLGRRTPAEATPAATSDKKFVMNRAFALVMFVVVYMVLFGTTVFVLRTLWRYGLCGGRGRAARNADGSAQVCNL